MKKRIFLGGACGRTTWRREIAIPALEAAGITYYDPQLDFGAWTPAREAEEMRAKDEADVLLFVITGETRGVAGLAEAAYLLAARRPLALVVTDVLESHGFDGQPTGAWERDDLNRGRIFVRTMAACHGVPVFAEIADAVQHAITLAQSIEADKQNKPGLSLAEVQAVLAEVQFRDHQFLVTPVADGFQLQLQGYEP
ncbi:MAG TPA: nucleoside 2-deoxyribosyltransferase domain-containing protein, partial [Blastocatellia bacterium]|nr:nucleoside 2-deoxyribosyltransferase domain-containing protein [Blastocatellia bacterium]